MRARWSLKCHTTATEILRCTWQDTRDGCKVPWLWCCWCRQLRSSGEAPSRVRLFLVGGIWPRERQSGAYGSREGIVML